MCDKCKERAKNEPRKPMTEAEKDMYALGIARAFHYMQDRIGLPGFVAAPMSQACIACSGELADGIPDFVRELARDMRTEAGNVSTKEKEKRREYYEKHSH